MKVFWKSGDLPDPCEPARTRLAVFEVGRAFTVVGIAIICGQLHYGVDTHSLERGYGYPIFFPKECFDEPVGVLPSGLVYSRVDDWDVFCCPELSDPHFLESLIDDDPIAQDKWAAFRRRVEAEEEGASSA